MKGTAAVVAAKAETIRQAKPWHVVKGSNDGHNSCIVAVRSTVAKGVTLLEWRKIADGTFRKDSKRRGCAESRILVARIEWKQPMHGQAATVVATAHMHYMTAKRQGGLCNAHDYFWRELGRILKRWDPVVLTGDFNMSLFQVVPKLRNEKDPNRVAQLVSLDEE